MAENDEMQKILGSYKQTNALLMVVGILLGSFTIMVPSLSATMAWIVSLLVVFFGAYQFYKYDGKMGILLLAIAVIWIVASVLQYLKLF